MQHLTSISKFVQLIFLRNLQTSGHQLLKYFKSYRSPAHRIHQDTDIFHRTIDDHASRLRLKTYLDKQILQVDKSLQDTTYKFEF